SVPIEGNVATGNHDARKTLLEPVVGKRWRWNLPRVNNAETGVATGASDGRHDAPVRTIRAGPKVSSDDDLPTRFAVPGFDQVIKIPSDIDIALEVRDVLDQTAKSACSESERGGRCSPEFQFAARGYSNANEVAMFRRRDLRLKAVRKKAAPRRSKFKHILF